MTSRPSPAPIEPESGDERPTMDVALEPVGTQPGKPRATRGSSPRGRPSAIGRYVVLDVIGVGGMGVVCTAYDPKLDRKVAIKLLRDGGDRRRMTTGRARMVREAQALAKLNHPNIVTVHDVDVYEERLYIAMEYVEGSSVADWLDDEPHDWPEVVQVFIEAGRGVAAAHEAGITHRDFKPGNVVIGNDRRVRVLDFGLAKTGDDDDASESDPSMAAFDSGIEGIVDSLNMKLTQAGRSVGTPAYMSPEQLFGLPVDAATDQFSFGVSLYEALYGTLPFADDDAPDFMACVSEGRVRDPPAGTPVPAWVHQVILRSLAAKPQDRFASMEELLDALSADPARKRRRALLGVSLVGIGALASVGLWSSMAPEPPPRCTGAEDKIAEVWSKDARAEVEAAFEATQTPYAEHALGRVSSALDDYSERWARHHQAICEATNVRGEQSEALMDLRIGCLDRSRAKVRALVTEFRNADAKLVAAAGAAVGVLGDPGECAAEQPDAQRTSDPERLAEIREVEQDLAAAQGVRLAGRYKRAESLSVAALERAEEVDDDALKAMVLLNLADLHQKTRRIDAAQTEFLDAIRAARAGRQPRLEALAWVGYAITQSSIPEDRALALAWFVPAELAMAELADPPPVLVGTVLRKRGSVELRNGKLEEARASLEEAVGQLSQADRKNELASALNNLGVALGQLGRYDEAAEPLRRFAAISEELYGPAHVNAAKAQLNLGNVYKTSGDVKAARAAFERALAGYTLAAGDSHPKIAAARLGLAQLADSPAEALDMADRAAELLASIKTAASPRDVAAVHNERGKAYLALGEPDRALVALNLALEAQKAFGPAPRGQRGRTYTWLCEAHWRRGDSVEGRPACRAALENLQQAGSDNDLGYELSSLARLALMSDDDPEQRLLLHAAKMGLEALPSGADRELCDALDAALAALGGAPPSG